MNRSVLKVVLLGVLAVAGWVGLTVYDRKTADPRLAEAQQQLKAAEAQAKMLQDVVQYLTSEQRVADVLVTDRSTGSDGAVRTTLVFYEYARNGAMLPPKRFVIDGDEAHIDAMVIKFQGKFVEGKDPLRGRSIALFTKLFDNKQAPEQGHVIDEPDHIPAIYKDADPQVSQFEQQLWRDFWKLAKDKAYRESMGVDALQGDSKWWRFEPGYKYTLTLQPNGGLLLRPEPIPDIYRDMLKQNGAKPATTPAS